MRSTEGASTRIGAFSTVQGGQLAMPDFGFLLAATPGPRAVVDRGPDPAVIPRRAVDESIGTGRKNDNSAGAVVLRRAASEGVG